MGFNFSKKSKIDQNNLIIKLNILFKNFCTKINSVKFFNWLFRKWQVILLSFYGLLPLLWFKDKYIYRSEEAGYLNYSYIYEKFFYSWSSHFNNGTPASAIDHIVLYPVGIFYKIAAILGVPNYITQRLFIVMVFYLIVFSVYKLINYLTKDKAVSFLSVLFFNTSIYMISINFYTAKMFQMFLLPFFFYIFLRYLETKKTFYVALNFILVIVFQGIITNLPAAIPTFSIYFFALLFYYFVESSFSHIKKDIKYILFFFTTVIISAAYTYVLYYFSVIYNIQFNYNNIFHLLKANSEFTSLWQLFRGAWWETERAYFIWWWFYDNPAIIITSFILTAFIFAGFFKLRSSSLAMRKIYIFWVSFFLVFFFLAHGMSKPFPEVYEWMYNNIPLFGLFREPWAKFTPLLVFSSTILFAFTLKLFDKYRKIIYPTLFVLIMIHSSLFFSNQVFGHNNPGMGDTDVLIPKFWLDAQAWSLDHEADVMLPVPIYFYYGYYHEWYKYKSGNFNGFLPYNFLYTDAVAGIVTNLISDSQSDKKQLLLNYNNPKVLPLWNVRYILDQKDISAPDTIKRTVTSQMLKDQGVINDQPDTSFGLLDIYRVNDKYFLPRVYASSGAVYMDGNFFALPSLLNTDYVGLKPVVIFSKQNLEIKFNDLNNIVELKQRGEGWQLASSKISTTMVEPKADFERINPTKYIASISKASGPFWLVFSQNHHRYWRAYIREKVDNKIKLIDKSALLSALFDSRIQISEHYMVNGYANGWYVKPKEKADFEIVIEYWPQRFFEAIWGIMSLLFILSIIYIIIHNKKIKKIGKNIKS